MTDNDKLIESLYDQYQAGARDLRYPENADVKKLLRVTLEANLEKGSQLLAELAK